MAHGVFPIGGETVGQEDGQAEQQQQGVQRHDAVDKVGGLVEKLQPGQVLGGGEAVQLGHGCGGQEHAPHRRALCLHLQLVVEDGHCFTHGFSLPDRRLGEAAALVHHPGQDGVLLVGGGEHHRLALQGRQLSVVPQGQDFHPALHLVEQLLGGPGVEKAALPQHGQVLAQLVHVLYNVGGEQHGPPLASVAGQHSAEPHPLLRVQAGGGLIYHQDGRLPQQGLGDAHPAPHAPGELADFPPGKVLHLHLEKDLLHLAPADRPPLADSVEAADLDGAGVGRLHGDKGFHQGGLARPVVAQQPKDAAAHGKGHVLQGSDAPFVGFGDVGKDNIRFHNSLLITTFVDLSGKRERGYCAPDSVPTE